ncbi:S1C family serine protease [Chloroflexota bacterium]
MDRFKYILVALLVVCALAIAGAIHFDNENPLNASSGPINPDWVPVYVDQVAGDPIDITYSYADLVDNVSPAVVSILTEQIEYDIFRQPYPTQGAGTGVIIDPRGYIVTNNHVIEGAEKITVILSSGKTATAVKKVGDSETDLAVIEIEGNDLPYAHFLEDSLGNLRIGDKVMAIGNAGGRGIASTEGTVSFLGEPIEIKGVVLNDLIRTSAAINPGNSGGPLVNMAGQVIGINVAIAPEYENFGFAISTNTAIPVVEYLIKKGGIPPAWLGVYLATVDPAIKSQYDLSVDSGVFIDRVVSGSPAEDAGLKAGDVIIMFDDEEIDTVDELVTAIRDHEPGDTVEVTFIRGEEEKTTEATLVQRPSP